MKTFYIDNDNKVIITAGISVECYDMLKELGYEVVMYFQGKVII